MGKTAAVALAVILAGCTARGILSNENQVVVQAWTSSMATQFAEGECNKHEKNAVLVGGSFETYVFECRRSEAMEPAPRAEAPQVVSPPPAPAALRMARPPPAAAPLPVAAAPPPPRQPAPHVAPPPPAAPAKAAPAQPPATQAPPSPAPAPGKVSKAASGWWVQVSADRSRKEAESSGGRAKRRFTKLLKKRTYRITEVSLRDVGTYYRSRFGPYASRAAAAAACRTMKRRKQDCLVTR